jgi:hypothetical protein
MLVAELTWRKLFDLDAIVAVANADVVEAVEPSGELCRPCAVPLNIGAVLNASATKSRSWTVLNFASADAMSSALPDSQIGSNLALTAFSKEPLHWKGPVLRAASSFSPRAAHPFTSTVRRTLKVSLPRAPGWPAICWLSGSYIREI